MKRPGHALKDFFCDENCFPCLGDSKCFVMSEQIGEAFTRSKTLTKTIELRLLWHTQQCLKIECTVSE